MAIINEAFIKDVNPTPDMSKANKRMEEKSVANQIKLEADFIKETLVKYAKYLKETGNDYTAAKKEVNRVLNLTIEKYNIGTASFVKEVNKEILPLFMISKDSKELIKNKLDIDDEMFNFMKKKHSLLFESIDTAFEALM